MKNFDNRISKLEKEIQNKYDEKNPCYGFSLKKSDIPNEQIIEMLKKKYGLEVTLKEFNKWTRHLHSDGGMTIFSPNFTIDKYILQINEERKTK